MRALFSKTPSFQRAALLALYFSAICLLSILIVQEIATFSNSPNTLRALDPVSGLPLSFLVVCIIGYEMVILCAIALTDSAVLHGSLLLILASLLSGYNIAFFFSNGSVCVCLHGLFGLIPGLERFKGVAKAFVIFSIYSISVLMMKFDRIFRNHPKNSGRSSESVRQYPL